MLFLGLCREAGIPVLDAPRERRMRETRPRTTSRMRPSSGARATVGSAVEVTRGQPTPPTPLPGTLFGVTEEDVASLTDDEFDSVWEALGKVARARARRHLEPSPAPKDEEVETEEEDDPQGDMTDGD